MLWEHYAPLHTETYSCLSSKRDTSILSLKTNTTAICDIFIVWTKSFINEINKKHSLKFHFKFSKQEIEFLDPLVYEDHNHRLEVVFYKKLTDCQNYLQAKSTHHLSLEKSIPYS